MEENMRIKKRKTRETEELNVEDKNNNAQAYIRGTVYKWRMLYYFLLKIHIQEEKCK